MKRILCLIISLILFYNLCFAQPPYRDTGSYVTVMAGKQYARSNFHNWLWGKHYRKEWATEVKVNTLSLETLGLTPTEQGGGRQSKTLRLKDANGKEYVFRTIDKTFGKALPPIYQGTFMENVINDQVSIAHPYAAITIPGIIEATGVYHTNPQIVYLPDQERLGQFRKDFANTLVLFEERADDDQSNAPNFGNSKQVINSEDLFQKIYADNNHKVDQLAFVRARLFDMFIGDWGRHEDQWRWASFTESDKTTYKPIPRDRDQVYTKFDGVLPSIGKSMAGLSHLQSFDSTVKDISTYNFPARHLDRFFTNETTLEQWINIATELQTKITDDIIETSVKQLYPEVYPISGEEIIAKLKGRKTRLTQFAEEYYRFLSKEADVAGSDKKEFFEIEGLEDNKTSIKIFKANNEGHNSNEIFYSRIFDPSETKEIRLYGLKGDDVFHVSGKANNTFIRIIPGEGKDNINDETKNWKKIIYDNERGDFNSSAKAVISNDSLKNSFIYNAFKYDKTGFAIKPGIKIGIGYRIRKQGWRKEPYSSEHSIMAFYHLTRAAVSIEYQSTFIEFIGKWNLTFLAKADLPYIANFFGVGNEAPRLTDDNRFYRMRTKGVITSLSFNRLIDSTHFIELQPFYQTTDVKPQIDKFISVAGIDPFALERKHFAGGAFNYSFKKTNNAKIPTKGVVFELAGGYTQNLRETNRAFSRYASSLAFYLPIAKPISLAVRAGGATINGEAEFYQLNTLGGNENLRGFIRERFYGKTSFYNNNELRFLFDTRNKIFNGKIGFLTFFDNGRIWQPGEDSKTWHTGYGAGLIIAPFNKIVLNGTYGISKDDRLLHVQLGFLF